MQIQCAGALLTNDEYSCIAAFSFRHEIVDTFSAAVDQAIPQSPFSSKWHPELSDQGADIDADIWECLVESSAIRCESGKASQPDDPVRMIADYVVFARVQVNRFVQSGRKISRIGSLGF